jgi:hypothetical protein
MKTSKSKTVKRKAPKRKSGGKTKRIPVDLTAIRQEITNEVGDRAVHMVEITINEVDKGHYAAMKYLFEMIGLYPVAVQEQAPGENSLAKTLLRRLGLPEETVLETEVTREDNVEQIAEPVES